MYATKRRRRSVKRETRAYIKNEEAGRSHNLSVKTPMKDPPKSNPSKRHRLRLNAELDHLASLLPFEQSVISRLDRLSILRLAVSFLRTKSYFQAALHERYAMEGHHHLSHHSHLYSEPGFTDTDSVLQALNGFMFVVTSDGEVFFASRTVEQYLGFHQSDIIHQSALELIHSEDREDFKNQLNWQSGLSNDQQDMTLQEALLPENNQVLYRSFTVRFRCLLDNTSGFITLEINGHMKLVHGQNLKGDEPPQLGLFAICCPFGPLPLLDVPPRDYTFKSKHKMDLAPVSMDHRGKLLFGYSDHELQEKGGYDLIHPDDLTYYAAAHQELIKTGSSGLIAYRLQTKDFRWIWLQTSSKVIYKNSKPDFVICTHRHLTDDEGRDLVGKRGSEFKLPYPIIDTDMSGLGSPIEEDLNKSKSPRGKKSKTQLRDYLSSGRKRKTPYREAFNGYNPYASLANGYGGCQPTDVKPDLMYPYAATNNFGLDTSDLYRTGYHTFASTMYPTTADSFRFEADKHSYTNGYYLEPRQYQHTLQYHGNGYTDIMAPGAATKYSYDMSKYGYDPMTAASYGLDLSKRPYDEDLGKYDDFRKYSHDYTADKLSRVNGSLDPLKTSALYGTTPILNNDSLISCNMPYNTTSPCSIYRADMAGGMDRVYNPQDASHLLHKDPSSMPNGKMKDSLSDQPPDPLKPPLPNGHQTVIRNASPRTKSPRQERSSSLYGGSGSADNTASVLASCGNSWLASSNSQQCKTSPGGSGGSGSSGGQGQAATPDAQPSAVPSPSLSSRIISPGHLKQENGAVALNSMAAQSNSSPVAAATITSVIQQSGRSRSCEKQTPVSVHSGGVSSGGVSGGIAVPVVKSSSWLHHPLSGTPTYDWHAAAPAADSYSCHQRALYGHEVGPGHRGVIEPAKVVSYNDGW